MADDNGSSDGGENPLNLFLKIGLDERTAKNTVANNKVTENLTAVIYEAAVTDGCDRSVGNLLYTFFSICTHLIIFKCNSSGFKITHIELQLGFVLISESAFCYHLESEKLYDKSWFLGFTIPANALVHQPTLLKYIVSFKVPFSKVVYIEHTNFRLKDSKDYYGLAPGKSVLLRYAFPIKCTEVIIGDDKETVVELQAEYDPSKTVKPKGVLHWVAEPSPGVDPLKVEVGLFEKLFLSENPAEIDNWLGDINPHSKVVMPNAYAVPLLQNAAVGDKFQFERLGYFSVDKDSTSKKLVFNRTVTLRDSYAKVGK
nr:Glutamine--tRNA ligase [Ipomoea batatas]